MFSRAIGTQKGEELFSQLDNMILNTSFFSPQFFFLIIVAKDLEEPQVGGWFGSSSQTLLAH